MTDTARSPLDALRAFVALEASGGIVLVCAGALAMLLANSPLSPLYGALWSAPVEVRVGAFHLAKPLLLWINDGLMAVFFLLVGLEIKREIADGELSSVRTLALPAAGAIGGMALPAAIYAWINAGDPGALRGWAIPTATDIAFALGVLALFGDRVPPGLKVFLMTLAILDDLGAIVIIAVFYTAELSTTALAGAGAVLVALVVLNLARVARITAYAIAGIVLWIFVLKSGVHATLAGVVVALAIPLGDPGRPAASPLRDLEHALHPWVAFGILPLFAFANAGVALDGLSLATLGSAVPLGIAAGLVLGKTLGVFCASGAAVLLGVARLPDEVRWSHLLGAAMLCGIGFTMSLFIGSLAFDQGGPDYGVADRIGIVVGSLLAAILGSAWLALTLPRSR